MDIKMKIFNLINNNKTLKVGFYFSSNTTAGTCTVRFATNLNTTLEQEFSASFPLSDALKQKWAITDHYWNGLLICGEVIDDVIDKAHPQRSYEFDIDFARELWYHYRNLGWSAVQTVQDKNSDCDPQTGIAYGELT